MTTETMHRQIHAALQAVSAGIACLIAGVAIAADSGLTLPALAVLLGALVAVAVAPTVARRAAPRVRRWLRGQGARRRDRRVVAGFRLDLDRWGRS